MSLEGLLKEGVIQRITADRRHGLQTFEIAERDIVAAGKVLGAGSYDWCLAISYNSMLQAGRALMFLKGYRPSNEYKHLAVVRFLHEGFRRELTGRMIDVFDRMRKKRHATVYDSVSGITKEEAEQSLRWAEEFVQRVKSIFGR